MSVNLQAFHKFPSVAAKLHIRLLWNQVTELYVYVNAQR